jgi:uncharacterized protein (TIGR02444 family)
MSASESGFRHFALAVYASDGVSPATLLIQERCDVDVNVLLLAAYVGAVRRGVLTDADLADVHRRVAPWQREVVQPLRTVRARLTSGPPPAPSPATTELRERIKAAELDAELIELDELAAFVEGREFTATPADTARRAVAAMATVTGAAAGDVADAISVIAGAAAAYGDAL